MEQAIKKAIEVGWKYKLNSKLEWDGENYDYVCVALLDPLFWRALGKVEGWDYAYSKNEEGKITAQGGEYLNHWHRFIDHLAEGKDVDSFFNELLKS